MDIVYRERVKSHIFEIREIDAARGLYSLYDGEWEACALSSYEECRTAMAYLIREAYHED